MGTPKKKIACIYNLHDTVQGREGGRAEKDTRNQYKLEWTHSNVEDIVIAKKEREVDMNNIFTTAESFLKTRKGVPG